MTHRPPGGSPAMSTSPLLSVIVPAYNEAPFIESNLTAMREYLDRQGYDYEILVAVDGTDGTHGRVAGLAAADGRISILASPERRGKGWAIRDAVMRARGRIVGFVDADNKTP